MACLKIPIPSFRTLMSAFTCLVKCGSIATKRENLLQADLSMMLTMKECHNAGVVQDNYMCVYMYGQHNFRFRSVSPCFSLIYSAMK